MNPFNDEAKDLIKAEDGRKGLVVDNRVFSPHQFDSSIPNFNSRHYIFLNAYRYGVPIEDAAAKAEMTVEQADRFLDRKDVQAWLRDRALKDHIKRDWEEPSKWWAMGHDVLEGKREMSKIEFGVWENFGDRVAPKKSFSHENVPKVTININADAVKEAFKRQESIDAEVVE